MKYKISELSEILEGQIYGNKDEVITGAASLTDATSSDISFLKDAEVAKNLKNLKESKAGAILVPEGFKSNGKTLIFVKNPVQAFSKILSILEEERVQCPEGIHNLASISPSAKLGQDVRIGPFCIIEDGVELGDSVHLFGQVYIGRNTKIGKGTRLYPQVVIRENIQVGQNCVIQAGAVIGSDGYGFYFENGKYNKIPQVGTVIIEDDVEIGSCTTIDRATTGVTRIKRGVKIDNLVQIAHNVTIDEHALLAAQIGVAGSATIGSGAALGGQVGVAPYTEVGEGVQIGAQSGVKGKLEKGSIHFGSPSQPIQDTLKQLILIKKLPEIVKDLKKLKEKK